MKICIESTRGERKIWEEVWNGNNPKVKKIFVWKLYRDVSLTKRNKFVRKLEEDDNCLLCGTTEETSFHVVVECSQEKRSSQCRHERSLAYM